MKSYDFNNVTDEGAKLPRCYFIDWLRVLTMLALFFFHTAHLFDFIDWHIKNEQRSIWATVFVAFVHLWSMPLLFLLAGAGAWFGRNYKTAKEYVSERFKRLAAPFIVGIFIIVPPQTYLEGLSKSQFTGSFFRCYFRLFKKDLLAPGPQVFSNYGHHLWFLAFLFIFSLMNLPLTKILRTEWGERAVARAAAFLERKRNIYLSVIPVTLIQVLLRLQFQEYCGWADFWYWFIFFIYGYVFFADQRLLKAILKRDKEIMAAGIACLPAIAYLYSMGFLAKWLAHPEFSAVYILFMTVYSVASWSWTMLFLCWGMRFLNFSNRFLAYFSEMALPFYILQQTVILWVGFYGVKWHLSILAKFLLIAGSSFLIVIGLYELFIRRFNPLRICFGLKPAHKKPYRQSDSGNHLAAR